MFKRSVNDYSFAVLLTVLAVGVRAALDSWLDQRLSLVTLFPAVALTVWISGYRAALIPTVAGYAACD